KEAHHIAHINEAFASQSAYCLFDNFSSICSGGSIAISHPLKITGIRQVVTGLAELNCRGERLLCTSMCIGS
ncbi:uncharacterized protein LACBIDRAFT_399330, partial [Laccaria bicolor S238N-H82]